ncbi:hypothetical protein ACQSNP_002095 [Cronobacter sakazakii]|uniref:hypothetical protein n=1 Tax=Cronobacter sakazakii TaxID=28141 RepID=UPI0010559D8B|nr:hypothetical protein [Cronobacter sakazakii]EKA0998496.1 hypothetical protein [Cronobacter sakazakii]ELY5947090.1 hypothetical protein [Cronobacter sakazakii]
MANEDSNSWVGDLAHETFVAVLSFYDKNPIIASIGFLMLLGSLPLWIILRFAANLRRIDNEAVTAKLKIQLEHADDKEAKVVVDATKASNTTTTNGG